MRIFLTGATGYIGSAVLDALLRANHQIAALVRTPQAADAARFEGRDTRLGDLKNSEVVPSGLPKVSIPTSTSPPIQARSGRKSIARRSTR